MGVGSAVGASEGGVDGGISSGGGSAGMGTGQNEGGKVVPAQRTGRGDGAGKPDRGKAVTKEGKRASLRYSMGPDDVKLGFMTRRSARKEDTGLVKLVKEVHPGIGEVIGFVAASPDTARQEGLRPGVRQRQQQQQQQLKHRVKVRAGEVISSGEGRHGNFDGLLSQENQRAMGARQAFMEEPTTVIGSTAGIAEAEGALGNESDASTKAGSTASSSGPTNKRIRTKSAPPADRKQASVVSEVLGEDRGKEMESSQQGW